MWLILPVEDNRFSKLTAFALKLDLEQLRQLQWWKEETNRTWCRQTSLEYIAFSVDEKNIRYIDDPDCHRYTAEIVVTQAYAESETESGEVLLYMYRDGTFVLESQERYENIRSAMMDAGVLLGDRDLINDAKISEENNVNPV